MSSFPYDRGIVVIVKPDSDEVQRRARGQGPFIPGRTDKHEMNIMSGELLFRTQQQGDPKFPTVLSCLNGAGIQGQSPFVTGELTPFAVALADETSLSKTDGLAAIAQGITHVRGFVLSPLEPGDLIEVVAQNMQSATITTYFQGQACTRALPCFKPVDRRHLLSQDDADAILAQPTFPKTINSVGELQTIHTLLSWVTEIRRRTIVGTAIEHVEGNRIANIPIFFNPGY